MAVCVLRRMAQARQANYLIWLRAGAITSLGLTQLIGGFGQSFVAAPTKLEQITPLFLARLAVGTHPQRPRLALRRRVFALGDAAFGSLPGLQRSPRQCTLPLSIAALAKARVL